MIVMIDNYDSFVYNLVQIFRGMGEEVRVFRNDAIDADAVRALAPSRVIISPGPCTPNEAGNSLSIIREVGPHIPTMGVCLGMEAIGVAFGMKLVRSPKVFHGKTSEVRHDGQSLFAGIDSPMTAGRYHSLILDPDTLPDELEVTAWADDGSIMAIRHREHPIEGVQFHPESVLSPQGWLLCENFVRGGRQRTTMKKALACVVSGDDLTAGQAEDAMKQVLSGGATPAQIASLITALRLKGETPGEIAGFARVMRAFATKFRAPDGPVLDTCGTGGDGAGTFNISTVSALVAAGAGCRVAKHGNRSVSSRSGSADVLSQLGVNIGCAQEKMEQALAEANIAFIFAPQYHSAMKYAMGPRREIGVRTVFNVLGPLTNPAGADRQLIGVYDGSLTETIATVLGDLGSARAWVVHGEDGLDEITLTGRTRVSELAGGRVKTFDIAPQDFGLTPCSPEDLVGGSPGHNAQIARDLLTGAAGPARDVVLLNAGAAIHLAGLADDVAGGIELARRSIDEGKARAALGRLAEISHG